jgi:guanosine-3',5'-bis(diphosphate) 3'-pyrophosphohydrolase
MIYTPLTKKAMIFAYQAHQGQTDKSGLPYIYHPMHIAEQMEDESTTVCALLHDVVEDTHYTLEDLIQQGYPSEIIEALSLLTHNKGIPYMDYVRKINSNKIASTVKLADLQHNSDLSRLEVIDDDALKRIEKYRKAMQILLGEK